MDDDLRHSLFDPAAAQDLVLARRPPGRAAVTDVVSDVVWGEVVRLLRWATAGTGGSAALQAGTWWRLAAGCAHFLSRYPGLSAEVSEPWEVVVLPELPAPSGAARIAAAAERLAALLHSAERPPLRRVAAEVNALGAAAISALADAEPAGPGAAGARTAAAAVRTRCRTGASGSRYRSSYRT